MSKLTPFLWFDNDAEQAADFYLSLFKNARKTGELRSKGVGPWPEGHIATISIEIEGQPMTFMNGGPGHPHTDAFSFVVNCDSQAELDGYWDKILAAGGQEIACGWIRDPFGLCWQICPKNMMQLVSHPKAMAAMMEMKRLDIARLEAAAKAD
jgi:predicted 3-demethylubiquinone-9 3-methyltransferase (glyoxalase superfamily)